ncbi:MAG: hypothetical protein WDM89_22530 [Rhizomicrobium sp.]
MLVEPRSVAAKIGPKLASSFFNPFKLLFVASALLIAFCAMTPAASARPEIPFSRFFRYGDFFTLAIKRFF